MKPSGRIIVGAVAAFVAAISLAVVVASFRMADDDEDIGERVRNLGEDLAEFQTPGTGTPDSVGAGTAISEFRTLEAGQPTAPAPEVLTPSIDLDERTAVPELIGLCTAVTPGDRNETLRSGDLDRAYIVHIPPTYDRLHRLPLVLNLHGFGSNARNQAAYSRLHAKADEAGFIVVSPDGAGTPPQWNNLQLPELPDDVAFISDLLDHLEETLCIDPDRIYAAGISNGSAFAQRLGCLLPDRIAGVAAVAAFVYPIVCNGTPPVPIIAFHGTADACVPYEGGVTTCGRGGLPVPPVETSAENWARHNGCDPAPALTQVTEHVRAIAYSDCDENTAVVLYAVEGGGHTWPGSIDVSRLGPVTSEIDATDLMWEFFEAQSR